MFEKGKEVASQIADTTFNEMITYGLNAIPVVGGPLAAFYRDVNDRIKFERIEGFLAQLKEEIEKTQRRLEDTDLTFSLAKEEWAAFIETVLTKVEKEPSQEKRDLFKNIFISTVSNDKYSYEKIAMFVEILDSLHPIDIHFLNYLSKASEAVVFNQLTVHQYTRDELYGSMQRLKNYGFLNVWFAGLTLGGPQDKSRENILLNEYGREFIEFALG